MMKAQLTLMPTYVCVVMNKSHRVKDEASFQIFISLVNKQLTCYLLTNLLNNQNMFRGKESILLTGLTFDNIDPYCKIMQEHELHLVCFD